ncbi:MAG: acyl-ACP--UDP-N-acetylglucosamine O-acyltransferase [Candidatus Krumholzibacteria bacterium]|nr:acyl-ACP--UDP-N-acetylglucosamine O-acyltransferase [Candidatus Krumholzibacteria bacterium]MDH4337958.1 acyl-ACP--UDP-N-acetylglucosamine O-acyltransferase [Candidatus Krumholzibacteria bacterium]MDH5271212.1 acyl-ACP--UDP-N-acetylglucosamine O-acyltransferase [Candidatus Krumholzibacteria bacterium]
MRGYNLRKTEIHPTAVIHPWARIGEGVKIGPYTVIGENVEIGDDCEIGSNVLIEGATRIGRGNRIFHGASVGTAPQDLKYAGERTFLTIGDENVLREFVTLNVATGEGDSTVVGSRCLLMAYAHVAHNCVIGNEVILANAVNLAGHVFIDDFVTIGGLTPVHQFVRVGKYAFIGGGSRVERDVPPFVKLAGNPIQLYGLNSIGLERRGFDAERRAHVKRIYKLLYRSDLNVAQVLEILDGDDWDSADAAEMAEFLRHSERGITK